ncbi:MAG TPA: hypothetical protein VGS02_12050 [Acidobacteriaceae bacterium]|nr:hypothetical protein [Acidobacteriaceae bacterium]
MNAALLLQTLSEIARCSAAGESTAVLRQVMEAQDLVLQMQRDQMDILRENSRLRERLEGTRVLWLPGAGTV